MYDDLPTVFAWASTAQNLVFGPSRGRTMSYEEFASRLWTDSFVQLLAHEKPTGQALACLSAYRPDFRNGHCRYAVIAAPAVPTGRLAEGIQLHLAYLRRAFGLRRVYSEQLDGGLDLGAESGGLFLIEGRLREHEYVANALRDLLVFTAILNGTSPDVPNNEEAQ
jgi:hypothetical protein